MAVHTREAQVTERGPHCACEGRELRMQQRQGKPSGSLGEMAAPATGGVLSLCNTEHHGKTQKQISQ